VTRKAWVCVLKRRSVSAAAISRPSRKRHRSRCAEAQSMPDGPAERGVDATRARARASARHAESIDGAEHSGSIETVMAGRHAAAWAAFQSQSRVVMCDLSRAMRSEFVGTDDCRPVDRRFAGTGFAKENEPVRVSGCLSCDRRASPGDRSGSQAARRQITSLVRLRGSSPAVDCGCGWISPSRAASTERPGNVHLRRQRQG
jgi:hypothetical protein